MNIDLKPCPFCGVYPVLYCDITDWQGHPVFKPYKSGYRPISYWLKANHTSKCFIREMNGTNGEGAIVASNWQYLVEAWNRRADNA